MVSAGGWSAASSEVTGKYGEKMAESVIGEIYTFKQ